ncbi:uncharacterized protein ACDP82_018065 [Pangshura tecta]
MRRKARPRSLSKSGISCTSGSGAVTAVSEMNVWFGEGSAHGLPGSSLQRNHPGSLTRREYAEVDLSSLDILLRRHEYSSSFCLLHNCLTKEKEVVVRVYRPHAMESARERQDHEHCRNQALAVHLGAEQLLLSVR